MGFSSTICVKRRLKNKKIVTLHAAVKSNKFNVVKILIHRGVLVDTRDNVRCTALHIAAQNGNALIVQLLLDNNASCTKKNIYGYTALHFAAENAHLNVVKTLINRSANVNVRALANVTPLHLAALNGHKELVKYLIRCGANINAQKSDGATALHIASAAGHVDVVQDLIECGSNVNGIATKGDKSFSPLHCAVLERDYLDGKDIEVLTYTPTKLSEKQLLQQAEVIKILLMAGAKFDAVENYPDPLYFAVNRNNVCLIRTLIEGGSNVNSIDTIGVTPLHHAARNGSTEIVRILLDAGAFINQERVETGSQPIHFTHTGHIKKVLPQLVRAGADVNVKTYNGDTPIALSSVFGSPRASLLNLLLELGANINDVYHENGNTALHYWSQRPYNPEYAILLDRFLDFNAINYEGETPFECAVKYKYKNDNLNFAVEASVIMESKYNFKLNDQNRQVISRYAKVYYDRCKLELDYLNKTEVCEFNVTYFQLLVSPMKILSRYCRNAELIDFLDSNYEYLIAYGDLLKTRIRFALQRKMLLDKCVENLENLVRPFRLPIVCIDKILSFMNSQELKYLSKA